MSIYRGGRGAGQLVRRLITVETTKGPAQVEAEIYGAWAVHAGLYAIGPGEWTVTHVATGMRVPQRHLDDVTKREAIRVARALNAKFPKLEIANVDGKDTVIEPEKRKPLAKSIMREINLVLWGVG